MQPFRTPALLLIFASLGLAGMVFGQSAAPAMAVATDVPADTTPSPARVVVVANSRDPDSEPIARYYMQKRGIPEKNLILIDTPIEQDVTWSVFVDKIFNPLRARLVKDGWLQAYTTDLKDSQGRLRYAFYGNKIDFLVTCYGIPVRILNDPDRLTPTPLTIEHKELDTNQAAVDSELSLLAAPDTPIVGFVENPLYDKLNPEAFARTFVVKVARLDGPGIIAVKGMIDSALAGEAHGLQGRAYIDMGGPHEEGENWLRSASASLRKLGFDISEDHETSLFTWRTRFDAPAFYYGWYAAQPSGPISDPLFHFPPGAIAIHIHSYSGDSIRKADVHWVGPLIVRGVAATVGNVFEPYLDFTHHIDLFMEALAAGKTTGEAAYYSLPALSWMEIFVGDPLYRPFAVSLPEQLDQASLAPTAYSAYAVIRQINLLQEQGRPGDALAFGQNQFDQHPDLALAFSLAQLDHLLNQDDHARQRLAWAATVASPPRDDLGLLGEMARWAVDHDARHAALDLYTRVLADPSAHPDLLKTLLPDAINLAKDASADDLRMLWQKQLDALNPPPHS
jgi:uncharacterized protein (TIGR03790 family)